MVDAGYAEAVSSEQGDGPRRMIHRATGRGREQLHDWLGEPVGHVRDLRIEFLLKLALLRRSGDSPLELIRLQKAALDPKLDALDEPDAEHDDHVELWRQHNAAAAAAYLDDLERMYR